MLTRRILRLALLTLCLSPSFVRADEPTEFPAAARQRYEQGKELQKKGQLKEALQAFDEAIKLGMDRFPRVHLQQAKSNLDLKEYDTAIAQYTKFIEKFGMEDSCRY